MMRKIVAFGAAGALALGALAGTAAAKPGVGNEVKTCFNTNFGGLVNSGLIENLGQHQKASVKGPGSYGGAKGTLAAHDPALCETNG